ncbi:response regulator [Aquabacterium sp. OR-4]|uniref:response regulator n=1 Tax=Aquabacterium sp. OR-4 TaxID=2978127 RepID=UPI0021B4013C|nr:response regulator [Aquabacterium sp. OR-4]MDT7834346.1 response regulator [Aquabacterium sp. OR-4]
MSPPTANAAAKADTCLQGTVLYIEDEPVSVQLVQALLAAHPQVHLLHAGTGAEGVSLTRSAQPDFVLLDMHLPDMNGLEVVRQISGEIAARGLRVSILTGDRLTMDIIKAMSLGAYEYWVKPLTASVFENGLRRALTGTRPDPARTLSGVR